VHDAAECVHTAERSWSPLASSRSADTLLKTWRTTAPSPGLSASRAATSPPVTYSARFATTGAFSRRNAPTALGVTRVGA
jgi:hypothetical protein